MNQIRPECWDAWSMLQAAYKCTIDRVDVELRDIVPLTLAEFEVLFRLSEANGRLRFIDLTKLTLLSQSRISRQIDAMQAKGYLYRESTDRDRRATYAVMTAEGEAAYLASREPFLRSYLHNFLGVIPSERLEPFTRTLELLLQDPDYLDMVDDVLSKARAANAI